MNESNLDNTFEKLEYSHFSKSNVHNVSELLIRGIKFASATALQVLQNSFEEIPKEK
jgi:hypothetical protein